MTLAGLLFTALCSACILGLVYFVVDRVSPPPPLIPNSMRIKIPRCGLIKISTLYALSGILITLSLDRNRVLCHLQDPIKGITLVFSLVYYFFFCQKSECFRIACWYCYFINVLSNTINNKQNNLLFM